MIEEKRRLKKIIYKTKQETKAEDEKKSRDY